MFGVTPPDHRLREREREREAVGREGVEGAEEISDTSLKNPTPRLLHRTYFE